jgi:hypothetical protein
MNLMAIDLEQFANRILEEKDCEDPTRAGSDRTGFEVARSHLMARLQDRVDLLIRRHLPPKLVPRYEQVLTAGGLTMVPAWAKNAIPDFETLLVEELVDFEQEYLSVAKPNIRPPKGAGQ